MHMVKAADASTKQAVPCAAEKELGGEVLAAAGSQRAASQERGKKEEDLSWEASNGGKLYKWSLNSALSSPPGPEETIDLTPSCGYTYTTGASLKTLSPNWWTLAFCLPYLGHKPQSFLGFLLTAQLPGIGLHQHDCRSPWARDTWPSIWEGADGPGGLARGTCFH